VRKGGARPGSCRVKQIDAEKHGPLSFNVNVDNVIAYERTMV